MIDLGSELRTTREAQGISLSEAAAATRIRERYLKALESNDWTSLPTPVQTRGFLRNYAVFLGLNEERVLMAFGQAARSGAMALPPSLIADGVRTADKDGAVFDPRDIQIERTRTMPAWLSSDILIGVALALVVALVGFAVLQLVSNNSNQAPTAKTTPLATGSAPQPTGGPMSDQPTPATPTFDASAGSVELVLEATEHVWVRVTVDGAPVLEGILAPGAPQTWQGAQQIVLETANGAGLKATVNGQPQGPLGERGQAKMMAWGPNGLLQFTPTASP